LLAAARDLDMFVMRVRTDPISAGRSKGGVRSPQRVNEILVAVREFYKHARQSFCHFVHFFASPAAADQWVAQHAGTLWVPMADQHRLPVVAIAAGRSGRLVEEPDALVVTQRLGAHVGSLRDLPDPHPPKLPLDLPVRRKVDTGWHGREASVFR